MSASLVGSEMCIRDRRRRGPSAPRTLRTGGRTATPAEWGGSPSERPEPVSYTHLTLPTICSV
eukprot:12638636-Alexandrium_andersonii.AAC.1